MAEIFVQLRPATIEESPPYQFDLEAELLPVSLGVLGRYRYGVIIRDLVICDVTPDRLLAAFELLVHRSGWKVTPGLVPPQAMRAAHLEFTGAVIRQRTFDDVRVRVLTNEERTCAYIVFDEPVPEATWVALTTHCLALVAHDRLKGFWVDIEA